MPSTPIPLIFRAAPLPIDFDGTPQEAFDLFIARLTASSVNQIAFFAAGSVAPTSNVGPWLANDQTWYVWSDALATYIPQVISPESLGYIAQVAAPDPTKYKIWIRVDADGNVLGLSFYTNGAWTDVYASQFASYSTTTQMNAAITTAVGNQSKYAFSAIKAVPQTITANAGSDTLIFPSEQYDLNSAYDNATYKFTAPVTGVYSFKIGVLIGLATGSPTDLSLGLQLVINGAGVVGFVENEGDTDTSGRTMLLCRDVLMSAGDTMEAKFGISTTGSSTWEIDTNSGGNFFQGCLIQAV